MKRINLFFITLPFILNACQKDVLRGEGNIITQNRDVQVQKAFEEVRINGSADLTIMHGPEPGLSIRGYENLMNAYRTEVTNGVLVLEYADHYNVRNDNLKITITVPSPPDVYLNGSGDITFTGTFPDTETLSATINGSGEINYGSLNAAAAYYHINGSGTINAQEVNAEEATVKMSGSGKVKVGSSELLKVQISGSGEVLYRGNPQIQSEISGSGKIISLN